MARSASLIAALVSVVTSAGCVTGRDVVVCTRRGDRVICSEQWVSYETGSVGSDDRELPESTELRVPWDDGSGARPTDPATLIGRRVRVRLLDGQELWAKLVDVADDELVLRHHGARTTVPPSEVEVVAPLGD